LCRRRCCGRDMGLVFSSLWQRLFGAGEHKIVMVGLDNAGKTTILYRCGLAPLERASPAPGARPHSGAVLGRARPTRPCIAPPSCPLRLALNDVIETHPTVGSNVEEVTHRNVKFQVWDLGGQDKLRKVICPLSLRNVPPDQCRRGAFPAHATPSPAPPCPIPPPAPLRPLPPVCVQVWATYYVGASGVILVVDSMDRARLPQLKEELDVRRCTGGKLGRGGP
jgi:GTPase SAR1 family protein